MSRRREQLVAGKPNVIVFETYVSSRNEVRVHIDVQSETRLNELEAIARELSRGGVKAVHLSSLGDAYWVPPLADVVLALSARGSDVRNRRRGDQVICEWTESVSGWLASAEKMAAMRTPVMPCHQYFEGPHPKSVTVELAFME